MATPTPTPPSNATSTPTTMTTLNMTTTMEADNRTVGHLDKIFLQTTAAQGIAGAFTFAAILITTYQVNQISFIAESVVFFSSLINA